MRVYIPTGKLLSRYPPSALLVAAVFIPVASFAAVTLACGTTAPLGSLIVPVRSPLVACALREAGSIMERIAAAARRPTLKNFMDIRPLGVKFGVVRDADLWA